MYYFSNFEYFKYVKDNNSEQKQDIFNEQPYCFMMFPQMTPH